MMMTLHQAAHWLAAPIPSLDAPITRVTTDSRTIQKGDLFIALVGERFDAHQFVAEALKHGAHGAIVAEHYQAPDPVFNARLIRVPNPLTALQQLATAWRKQWPYPLIAITGSNGKTSIKEMLATILRHATDEHTVLATHGNLNNEIGVPLTLLNLRPHHRYAVIEMGMNHAGEIASLTHIAQPDIAIVNNALRAHIGHFDSVEAIARAKGEIFTGLTQDGISILNQDDPCLPIWLAQNLGRTVHTFGLLRGDAHLSDVHILQDGSEFELHLPNGQAHVKLPAAGEHMARNAMAAALGAYVLGITPEHIAAGLAQFRGTAGRLQCHSYPHITIIDDTYNANPDSVRAAIDVLALRKAPRCLIFGDIGELGTYANDAHTEIGLYAKAHGIDYFFTLGHHSAASSRAFGEGAMHFDDDLNALLSAFNALQSPPHTVLVKGSRFMKMERIVDALKNLAQSTANSSDNYCDAPPNTAKYPRQ